MSARRELARSEEANQKLQRDVKEVRAAISTEYPDGAWCAEASSHSAPSLTASENQWCLMSNMSEGWRLAQLVGFLCSQPLSVPLT